MAVIAVTGGIASGKSTFCAILARRFVVETFDSDACARSLLESDPIVKAAVVRDVLPAAYRSDGTPDRNAIREAVFSNPEAKSRLEAILHPLVRKRRLAWVSDRNSPGITLVVDIPLLFETGATGFDGILTVACSRDVQISRAISRGLDRICVEQIICSQFETYRKIDLSDFIVWNDGSLLMLEAQAEEFARRLEIPFRTLEK